MFALLQRPHALALGPNRRFLTCEFLAGRGEFASLGCQSAQILVLGLVRPRGLVSGKVRTVGGSVRVMLAWCIEGLVT